MSHNIKKPKKLISSVLFSILFFNLSHAQTQPIINVGLESDRAPFVIIDEKGERTGFDVEITNAICKEINVQCQMNFYIWEKLIPALNDGEISVIVASMNDTEQRKKTLTFTKKYHDDPPRMLKHEDDKFSFSASQFKNKTAGVKKGTISDLNLTKLFGKVLKINRYPTNTEMFNDLLKHKVDFIMADASTLMVFMDKNSEEKFTMFGPVLNDGEYYGNGPSIALKKEDTILAKRIDLAIANLRKSGVYQKISTKYFGKDIYGI